MLVKLGSLILNLDHLLYVDLFYQGNDSSNEIGVHLAFPFGTNRYFWGEEAELLRWYFNHPTSKVKDLKDLKG